MTDPRTRMQEIIGEGLAEGHPTNWFDRLYEAAERGEAIVPWDDEDHHPVLAAYMGRQDGAGKRALVVGAGLGNDAEIVAGAGFVTTAFDISPAAIRGAHARFPDSVVHYEVADLLAPPGDWFGAFDLVVACFTSQAIPPDTHERAQNHEGGFVAPGGRLFVIATAQDEDSDVEGPPWPLRRSEFDNYGLEPVSVEREGHRWHAEFARPA